MSDQPIRLLSGDIYTKAIGPDLRVFLDGAEVDATTVYALDEGEGWIDFLIRGAGKTVWEIDRDPETGVARPRLNRVVGRVEVRLKDTASAATRGIYEQLRDGSLQAKVDVLRGAMRKKS